VPALMAAAMAAALAAAPVAAPPAHATRPYQQSLEGRKGVGAPPFSVTQRYVLTLPGSPLRVTGRHAAYADRDNPAPAGDPAPPSPGVIVLLTVLALVGAGALLTAPRWLGGR
jgi:predicted component of type VI protein secretion system